MYGSLGHAPPGLPLVMMCVRVVQKPRACVAIGGGVGGTSVELGLTQF